MSDKKVGILTFHCADNYGAVLQAYGLMKSLESRDVKAEIIDFRPIDIINPYTLLVNVKFTLNERGVLRTVKEFLKRLVEFRKNKKRIFEFEKFRSQYLNLSSLQIRNNEDLDRFSNKYDVFITGSDQVWNPDFYLNTGGAYFLNFSVGNGTKVSYAASIARKITKRERSYFEDYLKDFKYISVREDSAKEIVEQTTSQEVEVVLDPTFLLSKEEWMTIVPTPSKTVEPYIFVYDLIKDPTTVAVANEVAKRLNCGIISYSGKKGYSNWIRSFSGNNPIEFLQLIAHSKYVVTSSFHGTAFAIIFNKDFSTILHPTRGSRMKDLLDKIGLENRIIGNDKACEMEFGKIDYNTVKDKMQGLKKDSEDYLDKIIEG